MAHTTVLPYVENVDVSVNENITVQSINRNIEKLIANDVALENVYLNVFNSLDISQFSTDKQYQINDYIWYKNDSSGKLYLLKCIQQKYSNPSYAISDLDQYDQPQFEKYGWQDQTKFIDISKMSVNQTLRRLVQNRIDQHNSNSTYHKFGDITSQNIDDKLLKADLSNVDNSRQNYLFPYKTGFWTDTNVINGTWRLWDCGILELDIVYRLGYYKEYTDSNGVKYTVLKCNDTVLKNSGSLQSSKDYTENSKYFYSTDDMSIFSNPDGIETYESNDIDVKHTNRNNYVNTYAADIVFPPNIVWNGSKLYEFADRNYMIFGVNTISQDKNFLNDTISYGKNEITYCNKSKSGFISLLVTIPDSSDDSFGSNAGIIANSFHCRVIGTVNI